MNDSTILGFWTDFFLGRRATKKQHDNPNAQFMSGVFLFNVPTIYLLQLVTGPEIKRSDLIIIPKKKIKKCIALIYCIKEKHGLDQKS